MKLSRPIGPLAMCCACLLATAVVWGQADSDRTLEVPSKMQAMPAPVNAAASDHSENSENKAASENTKADVAPYLGIAVQYIATEDPFGQGVARGLEIVSIDPNSPAENAGLRGQGAATKLGASGATAGAMMPPLDLIVMPLLRRAGELGATGDLIVAIDDTRVSGPNDLKAALGPLHAGDRLYLTVVRLGQNGSHGTLKLPVKLGAPRDASGNLVSASGALK